MSHFAIQIKSVTKEYPGVQALVGIDLNVRQGSIHGFLGPNGAGKSTTMKIIAGFIPPTSGEVSILGEDALKNPQVAKSRVGILPETPPLYGNMVVEEYLCFVQELHGRGSASCSKLRERVISRCGLKEVKGRLIGNLSKGFKQRVGIAQALVYDPDIVILDEPTVALDPNAIAEIRELILELKDFHTILLSTHRLAEAAKICDEITIINKGKILKSGSLPEVQRQFSEKRTVRAQVLSWTEKETCELKAQLGVETVEVLSREDIYTPIRVSFDGQDRIKSEISKFLSERAGLIEFREDSVGLEEIFKEVVR